MTQVLNSSVNSIFKINGCQKMAKKSNVYESLLSEAEWRKIISNKINTSKFDVLERSIGPLSEDQLGFMGDHLKLQATINLHDGKKKLNLQFFAKSVPQTNEAFKDYVDEIGAFVKETGFFENLLPDLNKYVIKDNTETGDDDEKAWTCKCYFTRPDIIVLENLYTRGFDQIQDRKPMDYDHCIVTLQTLACFHASSVIFEEKEPKTSTIGKVGLIYEKYKDILFETEWITTEGTPGNKFLKASIKGMESLAEYMPNYGRNHENFKLIREKIPHVLLLMCEVVKPSTKFRNVICQGDLTINNLFFQYKNDERIPVEGKIIDFQVMRYNPPASEVMWFLYLVTLRDFREKHFDEFLTVYYEKFARELRRHQLDPDQLLSWSEFKESCDVYRNAGRMAAAMYFQQSVMSPEYSKKVFSDPHHMSTFNTVDKSKYIIECYKDDPVFRERNTEVIEEFIEYCILKEWAFSTA